MTTPAAERLYLAMHQWELEGCTPVIFNPLSRPLEDLPVIYGFNNGGSIGWLSALALGDDGVVLGGHVCSHEVYMEGDLGILKGSRPDRHEKDYQPHFPNGYRMEFVPSDQIAGHEAFQKALALAKAAEPAAEGEQA